MDNEIKQALDAMEERITARLEELSERVHNTETKLLTAYYDHARPIEARLRTLPLIDQRLGIMEERVSALERKNLERGL